MDLPDCPPGAEGYEDSVVEVAKKPNLDDTTCTKAEQEFQDHLNSLKIKVENGDARCMVERRGRDISGKWIYLCYPCAAMCSGESILQTHISGKKHKTKLAMKNVWPKSIFEEHPYVLSEKGGTSKEKSGATEKVLQKMAEEVNLHNNPSDLEIKYNKYRHARCHIQDTLDSCKTPLIGVEYLVEHPPEETHYEPSYICTLCSKQGHPRTIINHMTCFWHRYNYIIRHFPKASVQLAPYKAQPKYREGVSLVMNRIAQRIEDKYGRLPPVHIDKEDYDKEKDRIHQWLYKSPHFCEKEGCTMEEIVDSDLIESLHKSFESQSNRGKYDKKDPSPPKVAAPTKPLFNSYTRSAGRQERRAGSAGGLSDISDEEPRRDLRVHRPGKYDPHQNRYEPYRDKRRESPPHMRYTSKAAADKSQDKTKAPNYEYKVKLAEEQRQNAVDSAKKTLAYHEKNPEKHPLYPEEWKKFWNRRYKEIQAEGKDPSKHDFKPEWILFWTARMKELHDEELRVIVCEIYRKLCLTPPPEKPKVDPKRRSPDPKLRSIEMRRSPDPRRRSPDPRRRSPDPRRRSPDPRRRSPDPRHPGMRSRSPLPRRRSPEPRRRSPVPRRRSPDPRRRSPEPSRPPIRRPDDRYRRDYRSPGRPHIPDRPMSPSRSLSSRPRSRSPVHREHGRGSRSPLSRRAAANPLRNRSRSPPAAAQTVAPSLQTVLISDDEFKPLFDDGGLSPWNSDNDIDSVLSQAEARSPTHGSRAGSVMSRASKRREFSRPAEPSDLGPAENVVATLRLLVALEDYLGSVGPKLVDLLTEALRMEKEKANSSEELLDRDTAVVLMETAKEKLKGALQAGLVGAGATPALRAAVVRTAATLHAADTRARQRTQVLLFASALMDALPPAPAATPVKRKRTRTRPRCRRRPKGASRVAEQIDKPNVKTAALPVAGVGEVDRAQIAQQMAAALIAQGKTDVSSEELAQLVDAVVGMAEAKKREAVVKSEAEAKKSVAEPKPDKPPVKAPAPAKNSASALQLLQSAYDENDKKIEKEEIPDAMDGLSDSDLETLLKNFNELSAEEQHSLIAYLKKLEAREPQRVEKLRQYVSAAATSVSAPAPAPASAPAPPVAETPPEDVKLVTIESDDDDYTVEEVFQSATKKVKENQIRQEMEIVKKSLEESNVVPVPAETTQAPKVDLTKNLSAATDLFALVQASIQSTTSTSQSPAPAADVVTSNTQPRSGDLPEKPMQQEPAKPIPSLSNQAIPQSQPPPFNQGLMRPPAPQNFGGHMNNQNDSYDNQSNWNQRSQNIPDNNSYTQDGGAYMPDGGSYVQDGGSQMQNRGAPMQDNRGPYTQDNRGPLLQDNRGPLLQDNRGPLLQDNRGGPLIQGGPRGPLLQDNRGAPLMQGGPFQQDNKGPYQQQDNRGPLMQDNSGPQQDNRGFQQGNRGPLMPDNSGPQQDNRGFQQGNRGPLMPDNSGPQQDNRGFQQGNRGPLMPDNSGAPQDNRGFQQGNRGPLMQDNSGAPQDNRGFQQGNRGPLIQDNSGAPKDNRGFQQGNRGPLMQDNSGPQQDNRGFQQGNRGPLMQDNSGPQQDNRGFQQGNRGPYVQGQQMQNRQFPMQDNRGPNMQDIRGPNMQGNRGPLLQNNPPLLQNNQQQYGQPLMQDNRGGAFMQDNWGQPPQQRGFDNFGQGTNNQGQGPRSNFMNGNFDTRQPDQQQQQFGNYDQQKNFRGRGGGRGGQFGGQARGRGRGGFYQK